MSSTTHHQGADQAEHHPLDLDRDGRVTAFELLAGAGLGLGLLGLGFLFGLAVLTACGG